jgi:serine protease Do
VYSGGPIVNRHGQVVGIVTAGIEGANSINFGIDVSVAHQSLSMLPSTCECLVVEAPASVPFFVEGKMVGTGPHVRVPMTRGKHEVFAVIGGAMVRRDVDYPATRAVSLEVPPVNASPAPR